MSHCHCEQLCETREVEDRPARPRFGLFNRITVLLLIGWVLIVGSVAERVHTVEPAASSSAFVESLLR